VPRSERVASHSPTFVYCPRVMMRIIKTGKTNVGECEQKGAWQAQEGVKRIVDNLQIDGPPSFFGWNQDNLQILSQDHPLITPTRRSLLSKVFALNSMFSFKSIVFTMLLVSSTKAGSTTLRSSVSDFSRRLSFQAIAGYEPQTLVTDHVSRNWC
jgi:hypothetical protein